MSMPRPHYAPLYVFTIPEGYDLTGFLYIKAACQARSGMIKAAFQFSPIGFLPTREELRSTLERVEQWGWVIYRTVYTPQSDTQWEQVVKRLDELVLFDYDYQNSFCDLVFRDAARQRYRNIIVDDKQEFNNAAWEILEQHYKEWAPTASPQFARKQSRCASWKAFLIIEEAAIATILNAPTTEEGQRRALKESLGGPSITVVGMPEEPDNYWYDYENEEEHYMDEEDPEFDIVASRTWPGHFQVSIFRLYSLWEELSEIDIVAEDQWKRVQNKGGLVWVQ